MTLHAQPCPACGIKLIGVALDDHVGDEFCQRPRSRGECTNVERPCPWASCHYHVSHMRAEPVDVDELPAGASCVLDLADEGGMMYREIGVVLAVTRSRSEQLVKRAREVLERGLQAVGIGPDNFEPGDAVTEPTSFDDP